MMDNFFRELNRKEEAQSKRLKIEKTFANLTDDICGNIIGVAEEYDYYYNRERRDFPHGFTLFHGTELHSKEAQDYIYEDRAENALRSVCDCFGIDMGAVVTANRVLQKYYQRTKGMSIPSYKKLLVSVLKESV